MQTAQSVARAARAKKLKFQALRKECLSELHSLKKALVAAQAKLRERSDKLNMKLERLGSLSENFASTLTSEWIDLDTPIGDIVDMLSGVIEAK